MKLSVLALLSLLCSTSSASSDVPNAGLISLLRESASSPLML
eukprot:CAMPEP_0194046646 /NCGR_PEP_ID=MMETSP0009_2-20130614/22067_1 /TAXON_ID=210454 /ORGANISM="Grammatophora oceanica, Strain CCMP 410" /LENGTH=41 /DNA_ID= /DNA_START= /DNA_END= /DNA_ORIENTATION=